MESSQRQIAFNSLSVAFLLIAAAFGNTWLVVGGALVLLVLGLVLLPEQRVRGVLTAVLAGGVAFAAATLMRG